ncbi:MAG TPA: VOC family protein [Thermomicrobiales bacterium]|jgi:predicted enzyme related to lactoylglutathione lyase
MLNGPNFVIRNVGDLDGTKRFYTDKLGFRVEAEQPGFVQFAKTGGATYALVEASSQEATEVWWNVDDVDATQAQLRAKGVEIVQPPKDEPFGRTLVIRDAAGNTLYLLQAPAGS